MRKTVSGGYRAAMFETIIATERGGYADKSLYTIEQLPGVWRRIREPKGNPQEAGALACWFDDGVIYLVQAVDTNDEVAHTQIIVENPTEMAGFLDKLKTARDEAVIRDKTGEATKSPESSANGAPHASEPVRAGIESDQSTPPADGPPGPDVDV